MRIAFVADIHAGNHKKHGGPVEAGINQRCRQVIDALDYAVQHALRLQCGAFFIAGDLVDTTRPEPQVVAALQRVLEEARKPVILLGNHDQVSAEPGDHALGPFAPVAVVVDVAAWVKLDGCSVLCVPFQPGDAREWLPGVVAEHQPRAPEGPKVLLLHLGLASETTAAFLRDAHDAVPVRLVRALCRQHGFDAAFAGNWHSHKVFGADPTICQIGALCPTGWDNPGMQGYGSLVIWDTERRELLLEEIPGPRFLQVDSLAQMPEPRGNTLYVQVKATPTQVADAMAQAEQVRQRPQVQAVEVLPDLVQARAATRTAATVARSAETLEEALSGYVQQMDMPEGVQRDEVLATARRYLGGA